MIRYDYDKAVERQMTAEAFIVHLIDLCALEDDNDWESVSKCLGGPRPGIVDISLIAIR